MMEDLTAGRCCTPLPLGLTMRRDEEDGKRLLVALPNEELRSVCMAPGATVLDLNSGRRCKADPPQ